MREGSAEVARWPVRVAAILLVSACVMATTSCFSVVDESYLILSGEEADIPTCEPEYLSPGELETVAPVECSREGSTVVFDDGTEVELGGGTGAVQLGGVDPTLVYSYTNVGIYGTVLTLCDARAKQREWWGTPEGISKVQKLGWFEECPEES